MRKEPREGSFFAFLLSALLASAIIAIALQRPIMFPFAFIPVLAVTLAIGMPLYLFVRAQDWINAGTAAVAGAITGGVLPALLILSISAQIQGDPPGLIMRMIAIFALLGAVMGLAFLTILRWGSASRGALIRTGAGAAVLTVLGVALFQFGFDHSCHNPAIRGAMARYSQESFAVVVPESEWPKLRDEVERFARERGWSALREMEKGRETVEICILPGTLIKAERMDGASAQTRYFVSVEEPLESGLDFRAKFRTLAALQLRIAARFPDAINDEEIARVQWVASPDGKPSPTPSSAAR